jgi:hypothetical protein
VLIEGKNKDLPGVEMMETLLAVLSELACRK